MAASTCLVGISEFSVVVAVNVVVAVRKMKEMSVILAMLLDLGGPPGKLQIQFVVAAIRL